MTQPVNFDIRGMTCGGCSMRVQHVLEKLDGVDKVEVKLRPGFVTMVIDPGRVTPGQIVTAIARVGFAATRPPEDLKAHVARIHSHDRMPAVAPAK